MTRTTIERLHILVVLFLTLGMLAIPSQSNEAFARKGGKGTKGSAKSAVSSSSKKKANNKKNRRAPRRTYTVRGNPEVTRVVATQLLVEKLPELAALVGLQAPVSADTPDQITVPVVSDVAAAPAPTRLSVASKGITGTRTADTYQDSELDETEDTDAITADDLAGLEELPDDINTFYKEFTKYMASLNGESTITDNGVDKMVVMETLVDWVGTRYLFGGMGRNGIDCSAFTGMVYRTLNYKLPRTAAMQWEVGIAVPREDLQFGDLVFFNTRRAVYVSHVGMYLGNGMFAHASSRNGVTVSSLDAEYYSTHMIGARRYDLNSVMTADAEGSMLGLSHN